MTQHWLPTTSLPTLLREAEDFPRRGKYLRVCFCPHSQLTCNRFNQLLPQKIYFRKCCFLKTELAKPENQKNLTIFFHIFCLLRENLSNISQNEKRFSCLPRKEANFSKLKCFFFTIKKKDFCHFIIFFLFSTSLFFSFSERFLSHSRPYCCFFSFFFQKDFDTFHRLFFVVFLYFLGISQLKNFQAILFI